MQIRQDLTKLNHIISEKAHLQFYQLHYPNKRKGSPKKIQRKNYQGRSKSLASIQMQQSNQAQGHSLKIMPKNSIKNKNLGSLLVENDSEKAYFNQRKQQPQYLHKFSLKTALSARFQAPINQSQLILTNSIKDSKDLQQWGKKSMSVKQAMQKNKQQKIKANRILLSTKQSEQIKYQYLKNKRVQAESERDQEIRAIYDQFFRKQYEVNYGSNAYQIFQDTVLALVGKLSCQIFTKQ